MTDQTDAPQPVTGKIGADISSALLKIQSAVGAIGKGRQSGDGNYTFRGIDDVMAALHPLLAEHELAVIPSITDIEYLGKSTKVYKGQEELGPFDVVKVYLNFTLIGADGSTWTFPFVMLAQNNGVDKAVGSAQSYATRYMLTGALSIPAWGNDADPEWRDDRTGADSSGRSSRGTGPARVTKTALSKAAKAAGIDAGDLVHRANQMKPVKRAPFKSLSVIVNEEQALARELLALIESGRFTNPVPEPFHPDGYDNGPGLLDRLQEAAKAYKVRTGDVDYNVAAMLAEIERDHGVTVADIDDLVANHPIIVQSKIDELDAVEVGQ